MKVSRTLYMLFAWLFVAGVMTQVFFAGMTVVAGRWPWTNHAGLGHFLGLPLLIMLVTMYAGKLPGRMKRLTWLLFLVYVLQADVLIFLRVSAPVLAAFHPVLALVDFAVLGAGAGQNDDPVSRVGGDFAKGRAAFTMRAGTPHHGSIIAVQRHLKNAIVPLHAQMPEFVAILFESGHDPTALPLLIEFSPRDIEAEGYAGGWSHAWPGPSGRIVLVCSAWRGGRDRHDTEVNCRMFRRSTPAARPFIAPAGGPRRRSDSRVQPATVVQWG